VVADPPETRYTRSADGTNLAYQLSGEGPVQLVFVHSTIPIDLLAEDPGFARVRRKLNRFGQTLWFDRRGSGASEGDPWDSMVGEVSDADLRAIFDAAGFERPALIAEDATGGMAIHFAANHPARLKALILVNSYAHYVRENDYPWGIPPDGMEMFVAFVKDNWGTSTVVDFAAPSRSADQQFRAWYVRSARFGAGPDLIAELCRAQFELDFRGLLPSISVPTLVVHREGDRFIHLGAGRYLAEHIPDARLAVLPGNDHAFFAGDTDGLVDEIEEFLTGARSGIEGDLVTTTVLFTDIVGSTQHQARVGLREWSRLTDRHNALVRAALNRHRGHEMQMTGDGFFATFDGTGRAIRCATECITGARDIGLELRAGVHTGEVEVRGNDIAGLTVTIAKRACDLAGPNHLLVTKTVTDHVLGSGIQFEDRGDHELKGVPGSWRLFGVVA
jgi:class 3 adenylate cyclase